MDIITEIYQFLFISSIIFMVYFFGDMTMKMIGRFKRKNPEITYDFSDTKKVLFWLSLAMFCAYLIN